MPRSGLSAFSVAAHILTCLLLSCFSLSPSYGHDAPSILPTFTAAPPPHARPDSRLRPRKPYAHRFPRAESYHDLSVRIEPVIFELERATNDILIVAQSSVLRALLAYLQGIKPHDIPSVEVHEGELIECSPGAYGVNTKRHQFWDPVAKRSERDELFFRQQQELLAQQQQGQVPSPGFAPEGAGPGAGSSALEVDEDEAGEEGDATAMDREAAEALAHAKAKLAEDARYAEQLSAQMQGATLVPR